mmetsp:Transcript_7046/g.15215  ORF Transcript_7046/g.15215 Transcript_7046/m.15215 type:complete len:146 (-) Transcript_7046:67-504(-)
MLTTVTVLVSPESKADGGTEEAAPLLDVYCNENASGINDNNDNDDYDEPIPFHGRGEERDYVDQSAKLDTKINKNKINNQQNKDRYKTGRNIGRWGMGGSDSDTNETRATRTSPSWSGQTYKILMWSLVVKREKLYFMCLGQEEA